MDILKKNISHYKVVVVVLANEDEGKIQSLENGKHSLFNSQSFWIVHNCPVIVLILIETRREPLSTKSVHSVRWKTP